MKIKVLFFVFILSACSHNKQIKSKVIDTNFSKGNLDHSQTIFLKDVSKLHGHLCDGLVVGFIGANEALLKLYPDEVIDRTNTRIISKSSPCLADVAIYITGGRYQYNTFFVSDSIKYNYIIQRIDNGKTVGVKLMPGIKPIEIDSLGNLAIHKKLSPCQLIELKKLEDKFAKKLLNSNPKQIFIVEELTDFGWKPTLKSNFLKTDIINKKAGTCIK